MTKQVDLLLLNKRNHKGVKTFPVFNKNRTGTSIVNGNHMICLYCGQIVSTVKHNVLYDHIRSNKCKVTQLWKALSHHVLCFISFSFCFISFSFCFIIFQW